ARDRGPRRGSGPGSPASRQQTARDRSPRGKADARREGPDPSGGRGRHGARRPPALGPRVRADRRGRDGGRGRDRLPPDPALAPLLRPLHPRCGARLGRPAAHRGAARAGRGFRPVRGSAAPPGAVARARLGRLPPGPGRFPALRRHRRPQGAARAPDPLRRRPRPVRLGVEPGRAGAAPGRPGRPGARRATGAAVAVTACPSTAGALTAGPLTAVVVAAVVLCGLAGAAYLWASAALRLRGDAWPRHRDAVFAAGVALVVWGLCGELPGGPFAAHAARHLLVAMAGPVLLVAARPLTLALRVLPPGAVRRGLVRVAHSAPVGWLLFPPVAAVVDI